MMYDRLLHQVFMVPTSILFSCGFFLIVIFGLFLPYENVCLKKEGIDPTKKATREKNRALFNHKYSIVVIPRQSGFLFSG